MTYLQMEYIGVITRLLTIDPNFQRDIQVEFWRENQRLLT